MRPHGRIAGQSPDRRDFLKGSVATVALPAVVLPNDADAAPAAIPRGYQFFSLDEAAFTEALVDHMWPSDRLSPSGTELGIAVFIDRQLAGAFGQGDRLYLQGPFRKGKPQHGYQLPITPAEYFRAGMAAAATTCRRRFGRDFDELAAADREQFLQDMASGKLSDSSLDLAAWFNSLVYPLFERGAFADPVYGGNRDKAAWQMIGYPGLPAIYAQDMVRYRGRPHPRANTPQSIQDLS